MTEHLQVSNQAPCIKIAIDFIDAASIEASKDLTQQFHGERMRDILQLKSVLWHAWLSISGQVSRRQDEPDYDRRRKKRKNAQQHQSLAGQNDRAYRQKTRALESGRFTEETFSETFNLVCPLKACENRAKRWTKDGIFKHLYVSSFVLHALV